MNNNIPEVEIKPKKKKGAFREYAEAILTAVLIALLIRSFVIEAFKIPSSSMIPTLMIGDHIFVNKFIYGIRIPLTKFRVVKLGGPKRGDVVVFIYPEDESKDFIKRTVGLPGDEVKIEGKHVYVNGDLIPQSGLEISNVIGKKYLNVEKSVDYKKLPYFAGWRRFSFYEEEQGDNEYVVQYENGLYHRSGTFNVPEGHIFVMGDNRDNSSDSREWGFVPMENIKGKAMFIWLSLNKENGGIRLNRMGKWIH